MSPTFSRLFCYSNKNELFKVNFKNVDSFSLQFSKYIHWKLYSTKKKDHRKIKTLITSTDKKLLSWNRKIHNSQNLSHTNDQIHRAKLILFKLKSTKIDVYFETPSKNRDISIFLQGFCPASIRHDSKHTSATITENRWVRSHTSALLTNAFQKVEALILTIRS